jgi:hypothetical protein
MTTTSAESAAATRARGAPDDGVEKTRAWTGLIAVVVGDVTIALAAILGIVHFAASGTGSSPDLAQIVAILSSAFTAIGTMTTAYFGIKSISNTAKNVAASLTPPQAPTAHPAPAPAPSPAAPPVAPSAAPA